MEHESIINFLKEIEAFKTCVRDCRTTNAKRAESDAEHSWHLAMFLILLEIEFQGVDFTKILKLALIHDLPEIYAGDTNPYRGDTTNKEENEKKAAQKLFGHLPDHLSADLISLFDEYISQESVEAQIVKSADKLMPLIQNLCTNDHYSSYRKRNVRYEEVVEYMNQFFSDNPLASYYQKLLAEAKNNGVFFDPNKT